MLTGFTTTGSAALRSSVNAWTECLYRIRLLNTLRFRAQVVTRLVDTIFKELLDRFVKERQNATGQYESAALLVGETAGL